MTLQDLKNKINEIESSLDGGFNLESIDLSCNVEIDLYYPSSDFHSSLPGRIDKVIRNRVV